MDEFEIKKVLAVESNLNLRECDKMLLSEDYCLGIIDESGRITSFALKEDLIKALNFNLDDYPISLIATSADVVDINTDPIDESELKKYITPGLNRGIFTGKEGVKHLILAKSSFINIEENYLNEEYIKHIPSKIRKALKYCYLAADKTSLPIYLIGGIVRDIIISSRSHTEISAESHFFDVDITVEESAIEFSRFLVKEYPEICKIKELHEDFKTSKVLFLIDGENIELDIASTRKESYLAPAYLPTVNEIGCSIYDDLSRRDFTVNSMALSLNHNSFCKLIDPFNGYGDILKGEIKVLHPLSFVDDPTRIIRALKFCTRFNYSLENATRKLLEACINSGLFNNLAGERVKSEIKQTFNLNKPEGFDVFITEKAYKLVDKDLAIPENIHDLSQRCFKLINKYCKNITSRDYIWLIYFGILFTGLKKEKIVEIAARIYISGVETEILLEVKSIITKLDSIKKAETRFEIYELLEGYFTESVLIALTCTDDPAVEEKINLFEKELKNIKIHTTGKNLIEAGLISGPVFGEILRELLEAKINGEISTREDEAEYVKRFIARKFLN